MNIKPLDFFYIILLVSTLKSGACIAQNIRILDDFGFENLVEKNENGSYILFYENNLYRFEAYGVAKILNLLKIDDTTKSVTLVLLNKGIPITEVNLAANLLNDFQKGELDIDQLLSQTQISWTNRKLKDQDVFTNSSYFKTDVNLRLSLNYKLGAFDNPIRQRLNVQPYIKTDLGKGFNFSSYYTIPQFNNLDQKEAQVGLLRVSNDFKLGAKRFLNVNYGFMDLDRYGITMNYINFLYKDILRFNLNAGLTRSGRLDKNLILDDIRLEEFMMTINGDLTYRWNRYDLDVSFGYGSFLFEDLGFVFSVRRQMHEKTVGLFIKKTDLGDIVGFDFTIPLPVRKYNRKRPVRFKMYDQFRLPYNYRGGNRIAVNFYQGDNVVSEMRAFFPEIIRKGIRKAVRSGY